MPSGGSRIGGGGDLGSSRSMVNPQKFQTRGRGFVGYQEGLTSWKWHKQGPSGPPPWIRWRVALLGGLTGRTPVLAVLAVHAGRTDAGAVDRVAGRLVLTHADAVTTCAVRPLQNSNDHQVIEFTALEERKVKGPRTI